MKVTVTVTSTQCVDDERATETIHTVGEWETGSHGMRLTYTEPSDTAQTTVLLLGERVHIRRKSECEAHWILEDNATHSCPYKTPYGTLPFQITTKQIQKQLNEKGGRLLVSYQLDAGSGVTEHEIEILIKEVS